MNNTTSDFKQVNKQVKALAKNSFDYKSVDLVIQGIKLLIRQNFGSISYYISDLREIESSFPEDAPELHEPTYDSEQESRQWCVASQKLVNLLKTMSNDLESKTALAAQKTNSSSESVFIVHGMDYEPVKELKVILKEVGVKPIILHEQPSKGMTIIEKLEAYSNVGFAFIVLTPDDMGMSEKQMTSILNNYIEKEKNLKPSQEQIENFIKSVNRPTGVLFISEVMNTVKNRARQNVIMEFGYFIGRLGRSKVCCLYKGNLELPSDMHGICYLHFDNSVNEVKETIIAELKAANIISLLNT